MPYAGKDMKCVTAGTAHNFNLKEVARNETICICLAFSVEFRGG
jgi:hypothetical protein